MAPGKLLTSLSSGLSDYRDHGDDKTYFLGSWRIKYDNTRNIHRATASEQLFKRAGVAQNSFVNLLKLT